MEYYEHGCFYSYITSITVLFNFIFTQTSLNSINVIVVSLLHSTIHYKF